ncbi:hypothetical protein [Microbacterium karelineae]|uniref:hypothetical protein n=1 Tax=Microbacterium karelineae TaxID=2654283 RepID=UPI0012EACE2B|nr:hypothetical protein [Microbacterium karelineae]
MRIRRSVAALAVTVFAAVLASCDAGTDEQAADASAPAEAPPATAAPTEGTGTETPAVPPECDGFLFAPDTQIDGRLLGDCMAAAMQLAGSGVQRVDASDGTSSLVEFAWDPDFSMSVEGDQHVVVRGDDGWLHVPEVGWVKSEPGSEDPIVQQATMIVELTRALGSPQVLAEFFATSPTWTLVEDAPVPAADAVADVAWLIEPDSAMNLAGVELTDVELWLTTDHLGAYFVGTGTFGGVSTTTSNTFLEWGGDVEIPNPAEG